MRPTWILLLAAVLAPRFSPPVVREGVADPPIEIRLQGNADPALSNQVATLMKTFPGLQRHRTTRFEILSDLPPERVGAHGQLLERTAHAVDDFRKALGIDWGAAITLDPATGEASTTRALAVAFASREDFLRLAARDRCTSARWVGGYYAPLEARLVYFDTADLPDVRLAIRRSDSRASAPGEGPRPDATASRVERHVRHTNARVVVHEAVHLLLDRWGLVESDRVPLWLNEGLAASFEPLEPGRRFGPTRASHAWTSRFRALLAEARRPWLRELLSWTSNDRATGDVSDRYAAAASLCSWLVRNHRDEMRSYLASFRASPEGSPSDGAGSVDRFERHFGDLAMLETAWLEWERMMSDSRRRVAGHDEP